LSVVRREDPKYGSAGGEGRKQLGESGTQGKPSLEGKALEQWGNDDRQAHGKQKEGKKENKSNRPHSAKGVAAIAKKKKETKRTPPRQTLEAEQFRKRKKGWGQMRERRAANDHNSSKEGRK